MWFALNWPTKQIVYHLGSRLLGELGQENFSERFVVRLLFRGSSILVALAFLMNKPSEFRSNTVFGVRENLVCDGGQLLFTNRLEKSRC